MREVSEECRARSDAPCDRPAPSRPMASTHDAAHKTDHARAINLKCLRPSTGGCSSSLSVAR